MPACACLPSRGQCAIARKERQEVLQGPNMTGRLGRAITSQALPRRAATNHPLMRRWTLLLGGGGTKV